ncbi:MAG: 50S ribosomal protein L4 [Erysipelotrichaceae bacterium]
MPKLNVLDQKGEKVGTITLADEIFGITPNKQAMFDAVVMQKASERQGTHATKTRSQVKGGGQKPYRQKGTGRARQGSIRAVQWRGGGIAFGPTPRSYAYRLNKKVRRLAIKSVLSQKVLDKDLLVVDKFELTTPKTKDFMEIMSNLKLERKTLFVVSCDENLENIWLSLRNIPNAMMLLVDGVNVYDVMNADKVVITKAAAGEFKEVFA